MWRPPAVASSGSRRPPAAASSGSQRRSRRLPAASGSRSPPAASSGPRSPPAHRVVGVAESARRVLCFFYADPLDDDKGDLATQVVRVLREHIKREPAALEVEEEAAQLEEARAAGVVHVRGKTRFHVGRDTSILDRVLLGFYEFLHTTCRSALPALGIPLQQRVEIGMLYKA